MQEMPRCARRKSASNIYHVILRGIDRQTIFLERDDYVTFLDILQKYKEETNFVLLGYCLMSNHVHLLLSPRDEELPVLMKKIEVKFARWYNSKYDRSGYLFQNRYKSEPVDDGRYYLNVFRYIHQNPLRAHMESKMGEYPWSSYWDYVNEKDSWVDTEHILKYFDSRESCREFLNMKTREMCMEYYPKNHMPDQEAIRIIQEVISDNNLSAIRRMGTRERNELISELVQDIGVNIHQLSRLTGLSRTTIKNAIRDSKKAID